MEYNELNHHGILGMKWGQRRFQNKDGSLTPAGKKRYGDDKPEETTEEKRARLLKSTNATELYKNRDLLTTAEINERLNRIDTERRLGEVAAKTKKTGMDRINKMLEWGRKVDEVYSTTKNSAIFKSIKDSLNGKQVYDLDSAKKILKNPEKQSSDALTKAKNYIDAYSNLKDAAKKLDPKKSKTYTKETIAEMLRDHGDYTVDDIKDLASYTNNLANAKRNWSNYTSKDESSKTDVRTIIEELLDERNNK